MSTFSPSQAASASGSHGGAKTGAAAALAHPNIALIKYWGKRPGLDNLPAVGSLSITLDTLQTRTSVRFMANQQADRFVLNGREVPPPQAARLSQFLDRIRKCAGSAARATVHSTNNFPTAAGLASSASGFAALALAASQAAGLSLTQPELCRLARAGSGSAARSLFGGFAVMQRGDAEDGHDAIAQPLHDPAFWPLRVIVAITSVHSKDVSSTEGMQRTQHTSPYYPAWLAAQPSDLNAGQQAIAQRDFSGLAALAEHSCMKMHALAMAAQPPLIYWNPTTLAAMQTVTQLRQAGLAVFFTVDAGPQVKAVCLPEAASAVYEALRCVPGVSAVMNVGLGPGAHSIDLDQASS